MAVSLHFLSLICALICMLKDTLCIVESYSPSLSGISFEPDHRYNGPLPQIYGSLPYRGDHQNYDMIHENDPYTGVDNINSMYVDDWRYKGEYTPMDHGISSKHHHGPDCPEHGMHPTTAPQIEKKEQSKFNRFEKSLEEPYERMYYRGSALDYELLNNYNDKTYGESSNTNTYALPKKTIAKYDLNKWPTADSGHRAIFETPGVYGEGKYRNDKRYGPQPKGGYDTFHTDNNRPSYQTRTTYDPWQNHEPREQIERVNPSYDPKYDWKFKDDENNYNTFDNIHASRRKDGYPEDYGRPKSSTFQTYDRRAIDKDYGSGNKAYEIRSPYKELPEDGTLEFNRKVILKAPYQIFPSNFLSSQKYSDNRYGYDYASSEIHNDRTAKLNDDFKSTKRPSRIAIPYKFRSDKKADSLKGFKMAYNEVEPYGTNTDLKMEHKGKKPKNTKLPVGPQTRNPFAFDPCLRLNEGDYDLSGKFRSLFPYALPNCSFVKCANYRGYLNPCSTGTKNVASEMEEGFCTEIDLKGECGYSMNSAQSTVNIQKP